jgi:hypothetical protein
VNGFDGFQFSGVFNYAGGESRGFQFAQWVNYSSGPFRGLQLAGLVNHAAGGAFGVQIAPINKGGNGAGVQIGLINISDSGYVVPFGLINIMPEGIKKAAVFYDNFNSVNLSYRSGTKIYYNVHTFGFTKSDDDTLLLYRSGAGFEIPFNKFFINLDLISGDIVSTKEMNNSSANVWAAYMSRTSSLTQFRVLFGFNAAKHFGVFGGFSWDYLVQKTASSPKTGQGWNHILPGDKDERRFHRFGIFAGIQF